MRSIIRKAFDKLFSSIGVSSVLIMMLVLGIIIIPVAFRGMSAFIFEGTTEYRRMMFEQFQRGTLSQIKIEQNAVSKYKNYIFNTVYEFEKQLTQGDDKIKQKYSEAFEEFKNKLRSLLGPLPSDDINNVVLVRNKYGQTRWDQAKEKLRELLYYEEYDYSDPSEMGKKVLKPRSKLFEATVLHEVFTYTEQNLQDILRPKWTFYWRFIFDNSVDAHFFGGVWPEVLGTIYLTILAMCFAIPMGVLSAIYLAEYANKESELVSLLRMFINTLAGVPSVVLGLFGLAFFINTIKVSPYKSVLAGSLTLSLMALPIIIRASEEAILGVPKTFKEASLSLGASRLRTILTVILPSSLPGILTGIILCMGRAAGETAPIIFTAAVSVGTTLGITEIFTNPTPALPWNIYNLATEHEAIDQIRHVQYGMVLVLVGLVLLLNFIAIIMRANMSKKLRS